MLVISKRNHCFNAPPSTSRVSKYFYARKASMSQRFDTPPKFFEYEGELAEDVGTHFKTESGRKKILINRKDFI